MDPHQRMVVEYGFEALASSGFERTSLNTSRVGVFVGCDKGSDWLHSDFNSGDDTMGGLLGGHPSIMGSRLSFLLGLRGTALFVDTACSSGMVAVDLAA